MLSVIVFSGCSKYVEYELPLQDEIKSLANDSASSAIPDNWWTSFNDRQLNQHIEKALDTNYSLAAAWERLNSAKAVASKSSASLYPNLNVVTSSIKEIDDVTTTDKHTFGVAAAYEIDLWGRLRAQTAAEDLRVQATEEAYRIAALTLSANISLTWMKLIEAHNQFALLQRQIITNTNTLNILKARFEAGQIRSEDILRQKLLNEGVLEERISIETEIDTLENQFALLCGELPQNQHYKVSKVLPSLTSIPYGRLSSKLVLRRPDIRKAYLEIEAIDHELASAVRDQYPQITLSASYISEAATAGNLFSSWITTLASGFVSPLFDGGLRAAKISQKKAERSELIAVYAEVVLQAFVEVENALIQEKRQVDRIENLHNRLNLARSAYEQVGLGYLNGISDFLSVLVSQYQLQTIERDLLQARRNLIEFRISLYRALAGGFKTPREN